MKKTFTKPIIFMFLFLLVYFSIPAETLETPLKNIMPGRVFLVDNEGNFFVSAGHHAIAKYSPNGEFLLKMGQKGEGPSDIKRLGWFALHPKNDVIYVTEFYGGNKWISKFSRDGNYLGHWKCDLDWPKYDGVSFINFDKNGNVYVETVKSHYKKYKDFSIGSVESHLLKFSPEGKRLKKIYTFTDDFNAEKRGKGNITIPFSNYLYWTVFNDKIIVRENRDDFIRIYNTDGNLVKKIFLPFKKEKISNKDLDEWETQLKSVPWIKQGIAEGWFDLKYWRKRLPFPEYKPVSGSLMFIDSHGFLYSSKHPGYNLMENKWAKIDMASGNVQVVRLKPGEKILAIWKDYFFIIRTEDNDESIVIKINEKNIFKRAVPAAQKEGIK